MSSANRPTDSPTDGPPSGYDAAAPVIECVRALRGLELPAARTGSSFVIAGEIRGPVSAATLQQAGTRIQRRYPGLRVRCVTESVRSTKLQLQFCAPNRQHVRVEEFRSEADLPHLNAPLWHRVVQHFAHQRFEPWLGFMFRIGWVPCRNEGGHVVVSVAQVVIDEPSLLQIFRDLLDECGKLVQFPALQRYDANALDTRPFPQALLDLSRPGIRGYLSRTVSRVFGRESPTHCSRFAPHVQRAIGGQENTTSQSQFAVGASENCRLVLQMSNQKQVALCYVVGAAVEFALASRLSAIKKRRATRRAFRKLPVVMGVDLRPILTGRDYRDQQGMLQGSLHLPLTRTENLTFWDLSEFLQAAGNNQVRHGAAISEHLHYEEARREVISVASQVDECIEVPPIRIGCAAADPLPSRYGPLQLNRVYLTRSCEDWTGPNEVWLTVLEQRFHYSARFLETPSRRLMGVDFLKRVSELLENCHSSGFARTSLAEYSSSAPPRGQPSSS